MIKTPTNVKLLTNVAIVRMKKNGKRFEIACYKNKVLNWRQRDVTRKNLDEVLQTEVVFANVSKGEVAKKDDLIKAFETDKQLDICKTILEKGDLQVSEKERKVFSDSSMKEVATMLSNITINTETNRPYPVRVIEKALEENHFTLKAQQTVKQQTLRAIELLKTKMSIDRCKMRIRVSVGHKNAKPLHESLKKDFEKVEVEDWDEEGNLEFVGLINPGSYKTIVDLVSKDKKHPGEVELLSVKVVENEEIVIS
ncbi:Ribosome maturation protein SBDS [Aphelenchoides fujianensis]|nr:Ribosome maturation protein SBDS [Aphelenchoides fujianensis]